MTLLPRKANVPKDRIEPAKASTSLPIDPEEGEDDQTSPKSYTRGKVSHKNPDDGSIHSDKPTYTIEEPEQKSTAPRRSG